MLGTICYNNVILPICIDIYTDTGYTYTDTGYRIPDVYICIYRFIGLKWVKYTDTAHGYVTRLNGYRICIRILNKD
jgi:hypothetical protein